MGTCREPSVSSLDDLESKGSSIPLEFDDYPLDLVATVTKSSAPSTCTSSPVPKPHHFRNNGFSLGIHRAFSNDLTKFDLLFKNHSIINIDQGHSEIFHRPKFGPQLSLDEYSNMAEENHDFPDQGACRQCCSACGACCSDLFHPCMAKYHPVTPSSSCGRLCLHAFTLPPHGRVGHILTLGVTVLLIYGVLWSLVPQRALPGGTLFGLMLLVVLGVIAGTLLKLIRLPALLGMLLVGCLLRNVPHVNFAKDIDGAWSIALRNTALVVILLKAGLGLDPVALRKLSFTVFRLAFLPCIIETITVAIASHFLLGFPWTWGIMLGFVLSAVTPAVVVPSMLSLQNKGYGVDQGVPTLVVAAASVDDVLAITGFTVVLAITFSQGSIAWTVVRGPLEAGGGILYGIILGIMCWFLPNKKHTDAVMYRSLLLCSAGLLAIFGSQAVSCPGAGALGCLVVAFVAALRWRREGWEDDNNPVEGVLEKLWGLFEPLMFGLIGAEIDISKIPASTIGMGVAVIFIGLALRMLTSFLAVFGAGFKWKEKFFIPFAWLPKATVQAAIGSVALDTAKGQNAQEDVLQLGRTVVAIAVLVILITAPLGAAAIALTGPRLLQKSQMQSSNGTVGSGETTALALDSNAENDNEGTLQMELQTKAVET